MTDNPPDPTQPPSSGSAPPAAPAPRHGLSRVITILAVVIVLAVAGGGYWYWRSGQPTESAEAAAAPPPPTVTVASPLRQEIVEWDEFTGQFAAVEYVEIRARVSGYLDEIHFTDGQIVNKGDLLFVIDPRPYQIALDSAKAQLGEATARLDLANRQLARAGALRKSDFV